MGDGAKTYGLLGRRRGAGGAGPAGISVSRAAVSNASAACRGRDGLPRRGCAVGLGRDPERRTWGAQVAGAVDVENEGGGLVGLDDQSDRLSDGCASLASVQDFDGVDTDLTMGRSGVGGFRRRGRTARAAAMAGSRPRHGALDIDEASIHALMPCVARQGRTLRRVAEAERRRSIRRRCGSRRGWRRRPGARLGCGRRGRSDDDVHAAGAGSTVCRGEASRPRAWRPVMPPGSWRAPTKPGCRGSTMSCSRPAAPRCRARAWTGMRAGTPTCAPGSSPSRTPRP